MSNQASARYDDPTFVHVRVSVTPSRRTRFPTDLSLRRTWSRAWRSSRRCMPTGGLPN